MKQKYMHCNKCEDYTKFNYLEMYKIENLTAVTNDVLVMYECSKCHSQKPQVESMLESKLKRIGWK